MKRQFLLTRLFLLFALIVGSGTTWGADVVGTINFGSAEGSTKIEGHSSSGSGTVTYTDTGDDSQGNTWTITTVTSNAKSFTQNASYSQVGANGKGVSSITFTTTLPNTQTIKAFSAKFGGFSGTAGTIALKVGDTTVGSGNLNAATDVTVSATNTTTSGTVLTVIVTPSASKGVKCYYISYTYEDNTPSSNATFTNKTPSIDYPAAKTYSQAPTTAAGYSGAITYSMTANTAGASINASTGVVTVTRGGSVTVKATAAAVTGFVGSEDSYTLTVNDTRTSADLAWSEESADVQYGADNNVFPTLTNTHNVPVTYSSTNTKAATINASTGEITLLDITDNTTIKAIFAGNDDYLPQTVTYTLNVTKAPFSIKDGVFDFVEAASADPFENYGSGISTTDDSNYYETSDATWVAGNVTMVTSGKYRWWYNGNDLRFYNNNPYSSATFSVPDGYVITKIVTTIQSFVSADSGNLDGTTWTGASQSVKLSISTSTVNIKTITVTYTTATQTITPAKEVTTYVSTQALDFTEVDGLKAYIATSKGDNTVNMTAVDAPVPAGTALLLKKTSGTSFDVPVAASATAPTTNYLKAGPITFTDSETDKYILKNGEFYLAGAGDLAADKAYLDLTGVSASARQLSIVFDDEETTGINNVDITKPEMKDNVYYNLNGQRVMNPTKGLYIVNGKKVMINK